MIQFFFSKKLFEIDKSQNKWQKFSSFFVFYLKCFKFVIMTKRCNLSVSCMIAGDTNPFHKIDTSTYFCNWYPKRSLNDFFPSLYDPHNNIVKVKFTQFTNVNMNWRKKLGSQKSSNFVQLVTSSMTLCWILFEGQRSHWNMIK